MRLNIKNQMMILNLFINYFKNMLFSVIIPTKNRYTTLIKVVETILNFEYQDQIEIVIQDNSDDNSIITEFLRGKNQNLNLKYFYNNKSLSVIQNSDLAVLNSTGEFVCFIGDDDGIMPNIISTVQWMKEKGFDILRCKKPNYYWPDQKSNILSSDVSGVLTCGNFNEHYSILSTKEGLSKTLSRGGVILEFLPCLYHGIVSRKVLNRIYDLHFTFFPGPSPDMANAIALTQVCDSYVFVNFPVVISGKSAKSTGGAGVLHKHISRIEDVKHLPLETKANWTSKIPMYWTGPTIWAESVLKCLEKFKDYKSLKEFNYMYLYAYLKIFNYQHSKIIFKDFKEDLNIKYYWYLLTIFIFRVQVFISNKLNLNKKRNWSNVKDISEAIIKINSSVGK